MRGSEAGKRLIYLSIPFLLFGLLLAISPPITEGLGPADLDAIRTLGWVLTLATVGAVGFGAYLIWRGDEKIV